MPPVLEQTKKKLDELEKLYLEATTRAHHLSKANDGFELSKRTSFKFRDSQFSVIQDRSVTFPPTITLLASGETAPNAAAIANAQKTLSSFRNKLDALKKAHQEASNSAPQKPRGFFKSLFSSVPKTWPELERFRALLEDVASSDNVEEARRVADWPSGEKKVGLKELYNSGHSSAREEASRLIFSELNAPKRSVCSLFDTSDFQAPKQNGSHRYQINSALDHANSVVAEFIRHQCRVINQQDSQKMLQKMNIEKLREATTGKIRLSPELASYGYSSVLDVFAAPTSALERVPGIGPQTAERMKAAAQTLYNEQNNSERAVIGSTPTNEAKAITAAVQYLIARRDKAAKAELLLSELDDTIRTLSNLLYVDTTLLISPSSDLEKELLESLALVEEAQSKIVNLHFTTQDTSDAWSDYTNRPAFYQAFIHDLLGIDAPEAGLEFLNKKTIDSIRKLELNTSLMRDIYLRGYQLFAAKFLVVQKKMLLGDEMGLGKTLQAISAAAHISAGLKQQKKAARILVVVPASLLVNWEREIKKFSTLSTHVAHGPHRQSAGSAWNKSGGMLVTTYDSLKTLDLEAPAFVIVDEAHMVKNPSTQRTKAVVKQLNRAEYIMLMTGTPLENRLSEFAVLMSYLNPSLARKLSSETRPQQFKRKIAPYYLRRNQTDVLDELPEKVETLEWVELNRKDSQIYREAIAEGAWMSARRAAIISGKHSSKMERIRELVDLAKDEGKNVIIFSYFRDVLSLLAQTFEQVAVGVIDGSISAKKRQELVDELGKSGHVLLAQITAGGVGLNIQHSSVVILAEIQVKPSLEDQAIARAHRMGQINVVNVHRIVGKNTVDERLLEVTAQKRELFDGFAREADSAKVYDAKDVTEIKVAKDIIEQERKRLEIRSDKPVNLNRS